MKPPLHDLPLRLTRSHLLPWIACFLWRASPTAAAVDDDWRLDDTILTLSVVFANDRIQYRTRSCAFSALRAREMQGRCGDHPAAASASPSGGRCASRVPLRDSRRASSQ
eukprot:scaffold304_cov248-Pinguiococcus_pyrenoidosus.AAC.22